MILRADAGHWPGDICLRIDAKQTGWCSLRYVETLRDRGSLYRCSRWCRSWSSLCCRCDSGRYGESGRSLWVCPGREQGGATIDRRWWSDPSRLLSLDLRGDSRRDRLPGRGSRMGGQRQGSFVEVSPSDGGISISRNMSRAM